MSLLDERSKQNFLIYANSVIKSRAIPSVQDNLKPIHRRILWSMYESKFYNDKPTVKSAKVVGNVMGAYHPHGDSSIYEAIVRLSQWWKIRYPLIEMQGNVGNILGDGAAASRYTECKLSKIGMYMLEDINKDCVQWRPNFDNSCEEPVTLPSKFPYLLCGNNSGIAVGMGSDLVSHNFTETAAAIKYYMEHPDCSVADLMQFIKGPDFPTGGVILNGEDLLDIYTTGQGTLRVAAHYDVSKHGQKTLITFHDLPYGVDIDDGVKKPLKKLVIEDGYEVFEDISVQKVGPKNFDITITLGKNANVPQCLELLFAKTKLRSSIKVNQNLIINNEPKMFNLKDLIRVWVEYRSKCILDITKYDYNKTQHKLTVVLGLQKCMSDIDKLIHLIREASSRESAKIAIKESFELNDEQADAVLDMKLSKLSKLDLQELNTSEKELEEQIAKLLEIINNVQKRYSMIAAELDEIKKVVGSDERLTEIAYSTVTQENSDVAIKKEYLVNADGLLDEQCTNKTITSLITYGQKYIGLFTKDQIMPMTFTAQEDVKGAFVMDDKAKLVCVTANGNIKVSLASEYKFVKAEKPMKIKENDELALVSTADDKDYVVLFDGERVLKLAVSELPVASKMTVGTKSGFEHIVSACVVSDKDLLLFMLKDNKGKLTPVKDLSVDSKGNKGQSIAEDTVIMSKIDSERTHIYLMPKQGKPIIIDRAKVAIKGKTAVGAILTNRTITNAF